MLVSDDPRNFSNARRKHVRAEAAGMRFRHRQLSAAAAQDAVENAIDGLARDSSVHGVFVQFPLPPHLNGNAVVDRIPPEKDIDGLGERSLGGLLRGALKRAPATPRCIVGLLQRHGITLAGARAVIVGRSVEIARPLTLMLAYEGACATLVDPDAAGLVEITKEADILISAAERLRSITAQHVKTGAVVVDAGYNRTSAGVVGDVDVSSVEHVARAIVAMPDGIGPATIATLLENTWAAARGNLRA